jgi:hypothetical protein
MTAAKLQLVSKLSLKTIVGKPDLKSLWARDESGQLVHANGIDLFNVGGSVTGTKTGLTNFGEFTAFLGQFGAIRISDGMVYRSPQMFLPSIAEAFVKPTVEAAEGQPVEFAFIIGIKPMKKPDDSESYEYTVKPIAAPETVDPLAGMMNKLAAHAPAAALAAPETAAQPVLDLAGSVDVESREVPSSEQTAETTAVHETKSGKRK